MAESYTGIRCALCGRFMSYSEKVAYIKECNWNSYDAQGGDPPEMVPAHPKCVADTS